MRTRFLLCAAAAALLISCSSSSDDDDSTTARDQEPTQPAATATTAAPTNTATPRPTNTPAPTATPTPNPKPKLGTTTEAKGSKYTVNAVQDNIPSTNQFSQPKPGMRWVAIDVTQEGVTANDPFNSFYFGVQDADDYVYDSTFASGAGKTPTFQSGTLQPAQRVRGWLIFEIPAAAVLEAVLVEPDPIGGAIVIADLTQ